MIDFYEHIGAYKNGKLEGDMLKLFETELSKNPELRAAVDNHDVVEELMDLMYEDELRSVLNEESKDAIPTQTIDATENVKKLPYLRWMTIAASLAAVIAIGFLFKDQFSTPSNEDLFAKHMSAYMGNVVRGDALEDDSISACDKGHYFLDKGNVEKAKELFIADLRNQPNECTDKTEWYLCLIYLKTGDVIQRDDFLNSIISLGPTQSKYYNKAVKLQADLK